MAAAWMTALTGVGPSMASGSQTWKGNWADLPTVPVKIMRAMMPNPTAPKAEAWIAFWMLSGAKAAEKLRVPNVR